MAQRKRRLSGLQFVCRRFRRAQIRLKQIQECVYLAFRSATAYERAGESIPADAVTMTLASKWRSYTGYADKHIGHHLLRRLTWANRVLARRAEQREVILAPVRARRLARTPPERAYHLSHRPKGYRAHPEEVAFWTAIRAGSGGRTTWLVYADWLDEHDDPIAARAIRAQHRVEYYVGTVSQAVYACGPEAWSGDLAQRGKMISNGPLVAYPCYGRSTGRYKVFAVA